MRQTAEICANLFLILLLSAQTRRKRDQQMVIGCNSPFFFFDFQQIFDQDTRLSKFAK